MGGGGEAWSKDHKDILDHAKGLGFSRHTGTSYPPLDAPKSEWTGWADKFNNWKSSELAKDTPIWAISPGDTAPSSGGTPTSGGTPDVKYPWDDPTNKDNPYHPILVPEYNDPQAQDWSRWMPRGQQGANVRPGDIWSGGPDLSGGGGLLYQPWSQEYGDKYVPENIWDYQPPELTVGRPEYYQNPLGIMEVTDYVPPSESESDDDYDWVNDPEGRKGLPDPGYDNDPNRPGGWIDNSFGSALADALGLGLGESEADVDADIAAADEGHGLVA